MSNDLKQKTLHSMKWLAVDKFGQQAIQLLIGIVLARNLAQEDYGIMGAVAVFIALGFVLVESGFSQSLIKKQNANETDYNSVFYFNIGVALIIYVLLFFSAPLIAYYFKEPRLLDITRVLFLVIPINALYLVPFAKLNKEMNYRDMAIVNISAVLVSGTVAIIMVFKDFGVWTLVTQQLVLQSTRVIVYYMIVRWFPKRMFSFKAIRSFSSFSLNLLFTSVLNVVFYNIFNLIFARYYSMRVAGNNNQANKLSESVNQSFVVILTGSNFALFSKLQENTERLKNVYRSLAKRSSIITFPVQLLLIAIAQPLIITLYKEKWVEAVPYFQLIVASSIFSVLYFMSISLLNARGKSNKTFRLELVKKGLIILGILIGSRFGIFAMLIGYVVASVVSYFLAILMVKKEINHYLKHQIADFIEPFLVGTLLSTVCYLLSFVIENYFLLLVSQLFVFGTLYLSWLYFRQRELWNLGLSYIQNMLNKKKGNRR